MPRKVLWASNPAHVSSGYGVQTRIFAPRIKRLGYEIAVTATAGLAGSPIDWQGITVFPSYADAYGRDVLLPRAGSYFGSYQQGLVLIHLDMWVYDPRTLEQLCVASLCPVDHDPVPPQVVDVLKKGHVIPIAFSQFGREQLSNADLDPLYVPLGVETNVYRPMSRPEARAALGIPEDAFLVGMVAANKGKFPRKSFPQVFEAFAELRRRHSDALLYLHTEVTGRVQDGLPLRDVARVVGIPPEALVVCDQHTYSLSFSDEYLRAAYSAMDVLAAPSGGEGFGLPLIEAQACGTPIITSDFTATKELCGAGWLVSGTRFMTPLLSYQLIPDVGQILDAMEEAYNRRGDEILRRRARDFALQYDADLITETHWRPVLETIMTERIIWDRPMPARRTKPALPDLPSDLVSVIVTTANVRSRTTRRCLGHLAKTTVPYELILIQRNHGWSFAEVVDQGLAAAKGQYLLLLNDDCFVEPDTIERLRDGLAATAGRVGVVGGLLLYPNGRVQHAGGYVPADLEPNHYLLGQDILDSDPPIRDVDYVTGALFMTRRDVIEKIGALDTSLGRAYEDTDFCLRARQAGYRVLIEPRAKAIHLHSATRRKSLAVDQQIARISRDRFQKKNSRPSTSP